MAFYFFKSNTISYGIHICVSFLLESFVRKAKFECLFHAHWYFLEKSLNIVGIDYQVDLGTIQFFFFCMKKPDKRRTAGVRPMKNQP